MNWVKLVKCSCCILFNTLNLPNVLRVHIIILLILIGFNKVEVLVNFSLQTLLTLTLEDIVKAFFAFVKHFELPPQKGEENFHIHAYL